MDPSLVPALFDAFTVARLGSVGAAAKQLGKTPSAVSQQLRHLSDVSGVTLFERRGRGVRLTAAGERVLPLATRLFDEAETLFRLLGELSGESTTTLRIAASDYLARPLVVPVLHELAAEGVPLHFEITTAHSEEALARLERGDVELAIVSYSGERVGLEAHTLFEQPFVWIAPKRPRGGRKAKPHGSITERLSREPLLRLAPGSVGRRLLDEWLDRHNVRATSTIDVPSVSLLIAYATGGVGVGLIPALSLEIATSLRGVELEPAKLEPLAVKLVLREGRRRDAAVDHFVERLEHQAERLARRRSAWRASVTT